MDSDQGKLFIGGISWETTEEKLTEHFGNYGQILQTVVMRDKLTGRPRGFDFVAFADPFVLDRVLQDKHTIDGRTVEAKRALSREEQQNTSRSGNPGAGRSFGGGANVKTKKIFVVKRKQKSLYFAQSEDAQRVFDGILEKTVVSWNSMISGYFSNGFATKAVPDLCNRSKKQNAEPGTYSKMLIRDNEFNGEEGAEVLQICNPRWWRCSSKEFVEQGIKPGELAVISKENVGPYHRPYISKEYLLSIEVTLDVCYNFQKHLISIVPDIHVSPPKWYAEQGIQLILNTTIVKADLSLKILSAASGTIFKYNVLIIATGCVSTKFSDWGFCKAEPKNVFYLRDLCDADRIREVIKAKESKKVVIGGASYINLEIAAAMKMNNFDKVSIRFPEPWCMPTLFRHPSISSFYESYFASKGVEIMAGTGIDEVLACENGELKAVKLSNRRVYDADVFILVLPNIPVATLFYGQAEIEKVGIKTDGHMRTSVPDVYVVGDVVTFPSKMDNDFRKVEQVDHVRKSAEHAVKAERLFDFYETC